MKKPLQNGITYKVIKERVKQLNPYKNPRFSQLDDISGARLFAEVFHDVARYNTSVKAWYIYDGIVWRVDADSMIIEDYAKKLARALWLYAADVESEGYKNYVKGYGDRKKRNTIIQDARSFCYISKQELDQHPELFNCLNCVINLETLEVMDHDSELLLSQCANVEYHEGAKSADFEKFIKQIMMNDEEKIKYIRAILGYAMTGSNTQEEFYLLYGSTTRNGKSTLLDTIEYLFGDYASTIQPETLAQQKDRNSRSASGDIARLDGVRLLHMSEPPKRMKFDVALLKTLLGRDKITARHLYEREFEFVPVFKLLINSNFLPVVTDDTLFASGRVKVITFDRHFTPEEQDVGLKNRLKTPSNLSGILNWLLAGLKDYINATNKLTPPESVKQATEEYREKSDKIKLFMHDCLEESNGSNIAAKQAYEIYTNWCRDNGFGVENKSNFMDDFRSKGLLSSSGTVDGQTVRNVIKGYSLQSDWIPSPLNGTTENVQNVQN